MGAQGLQVRQRSEEAGERLREREGTQARQQAQRIPDRGEVPGRPSTQREPGKGALGVAGPGERILKVPQPRRVLHEGTDAGLTPFDGRNIHQGPQQPLPEGAPPHGGPAAIQTGEQRDGPLRELRDQLQVALRRRVQAHSVTGAQRRDAQHVTHRAELRRGQVVQHGPGGARTGIVLLDTEGCEARPSQGRAQALRRRPRAEDLGRGGQKRIPLQKIGGSAKGRGMQHLAGREGREERGGLLGGQGSRLQAAGLDGQKRQRDAAVLQRKDRGQAPRVPALLRDVGARRHEAHHAPLHDALTRRLPDLLADGRAAAGLDEPPQVKGKRMVRHARHGDLPVGIPGRQGNIQDRRGGARVVEEQFVEVPHAEEQQRVGILRLPLPVLAQPGSHLDVVGYGHRLVSSSSCARAQILSAIVIRFSLFAFPFYYRPRPSSTPAPS